jgi:hypothetical protein
VAARIDKGVRAWRRELTALTRPGNPGRRNGARPPAAAGHRAALLATALLGARHGAAAGEQLAETVGAQRAVDLVDAARARLDQAVAGVLRRERDRRLAPVEDRDVTAAQQSSLIAALSVLHREHRDFGDLGHFGDYREYRDHKER